MHKYHMGEKVNLQVNEWGNCGNGSWAYGVVVAQIFVNGKLAYDIINERGNTICNVMEIFE